MSTYKQFEDLPVWQKAKEIVKSIIIFPETITLEKIMG